MRNNLLILDKKLQEQFGGPVSEKRSSAKESIKGSQASRVSSNIGSQRSNKSALMRLGLNISSQERPINSSYLKDKSGRSMHNRTTNLNRSTVGQKPANDWDNIIKNDVRKYEEEQRQCALKKQQLKRKIMDDLNAQMQEKRKIERKQKENEIKMEKVRQGVNHEHERHLIQQELRKSRKNADQRKIMETQIAELENMKKFERDNDRVLAVHEKEQVDQALQDELSRERKKKREYQKVCQKQYDENIQLKETIKQQEQEKLRNEAIRKKDMFGDMFEERKHVSYEYAARNQQKFEALNKILDHENERKNRVKNYAEFEEGVNSLEKKQHLSEQLNQNRLKERLRNNRNYLEEQINFKKRQNRFEKDLELNAAKQMNDKAQEELNREAERHQDQRFKCMKHNDELKTQMNFKQDQFTLMTEQERKMNRDKLDNYE